MGTRPQHTPAYRRLCKTLRRWRNDAELTQRALGERLGKQHTYIHKAESGDRRIDPIELAQWARACGVDPDTVLSAMGFRARR